MKEFEFDDIVVSDENEVEEPKKEENSSDSLYQKFSFDIDTAEENKVEKNDDIEVVSANDIFEQDIIEKPSINNLFEEKEEIVEEKPLFSNSNEEIDNPFTNVEQPKEEKEEVEENVFEEANKNEKPVISFKDEVESKEDALEEALSHTTKLTPFKEEKPKVEIEDSELEDTKEGKEGNGIAYLIILFIILLLAIFVIPKIASLL